MKKIVRRPRQDRGIETKNKIIDAATKFFSEKGYVRTNIKDIVSAADVSVGCFYAYFPDKKAVFLESLKRYVAANSTSLSQEIEAMSDLDLSGIQMIKHLIGLVFKSHDVFTEFHREFMTGNISDPEISQFLIESENHTKNIIYEFLLTLSDRLKVTDLDAATWVVFKSTQAVVDFIMFAEPDINKHRITEELAVMLELYLFKEYQ